MKKNKKKIREEFRNACLKRDGYKCVICGFKPQNVDELDCHHICNREEMPSGGYVKENGITLCTDRSPKSPNCHIKAEQFHINRKALPGFSMDDLYKKIGSSLGQAVEASKKLGD